MRSYRVGSGLENRRTGIGSAVRRNMLGEMNVIRPVAVVVTNKDRKRQWFDLNNEQQDSYALDMQGMISKAMEKDMKLWYKSTRRPSLRALKASGIDTALIDSNLTTDENRRLLRPSMRDMEGRL